ncbi:ATPase associated with various cellular activities AAA_5 [Methanobacterium lacus]|uniref:ATPase associated with various cellular activities AAA_5 n=1 Tax=Methanobacterium lacus (strain AL-21) TaxID=877455 RepID=F0TAN3_METLA|nr:MoxR family ATPase [Methanobacterium lacus]ADZ10105.1 ATPase associated with various cellular activities AAA_5 [Methanobacterium lacus]
MNTHDLSMEELEEKLIENNYIPDKNTLITVYLAFKLKKPLIVEGPPGVGKTELSKAISRSFNMDFFRVQCYEGITFEQIVGEWNYQKQLLHLEMNRIKEIKETDLDVFHEEFFIKRPLLQGFINPDPSIILIDEIDKADEEVESFLLQALGESQITVNDLGTFELNNDLMVIMTSNSQRQLLDETKDRCLFLYIDYPTPEREMEIVKATLPDASQKLIESVVKRINELRNMNLVKKPSIRATIDWVKTLMNFNETELNQENFKDTVTVVLKSEDDKKKVMKKY